MQFHKKTSFGKLGIIVKIILSFILLFVVVTFVNKIDFPSPNKKIEKIIPNENIRIVK